MKPHQRSLLAKDSMLLVSDAVEAGRRNGSIHLCPPRLCHRRRHRCKPGGSGLLHADAIARGDQCARHPCSICAAGRRAAVTKRSDSESGGPIAGPKPGVGYVIRPVGNFNFRPAVGGAVSLRGPPNLVTGAGLSGRRGIRHLANHGPAQVVGFHAGAPGVGCFATASTSADHPHIF